MFTGIVQDTVEIVQITEQQDFRTHVVRLDKELRKNLAIGASVAHNGCCLTVTHIKDDLISFDLMQETLRVTNLGELKVGDRVNIERAAKFGDEIGGHSMSGHIMATTNLSQINRTSNNYQIWFQIPEDLAKYIFSKGYIGIDGASLTIGDIKDGQFSVNLIPETLARTNLGCREINDCINLEIDPQTQAIVDTVERVLAERN